MTTAGSPSTAPTASPTQRPYKLMRARRGRMIAGVASGLAKASGLDVTVVRVCIGAAMLSGLGVIGYILLWIVLPEEQPSRGRVIDPAPENAARVIRITLVVAAVLGALHKIGVFWPFTSADARTDLGFDGILGLILLSVGVGVLFSRHRPDHNWWTASQTTPAAAAPTRTEATGVGSDVVTPTWQAGHRTDDSAVDDTDTLDERRGIGSALGWARALGWFVLLWWVVGVIGVVALWHYGAIAISAPVVLAIACWLVFTAVLNTLIRVRHPSAVIATLFLLAIPVLIGLASVRAEGPVGTRTLRPIGTAELNRTYRQAVGEFELDLSATQFDARHATDVDAHIGTGAMIITVPDDIAVTVDSKIKTGGSDVFSKRTTFGVGQRETLRFAGCEGSPTLRLHVRGGAGWIQVKRANNHANATCMAGR